MGDKTVNKHAFLLALMLSLLSSCQPSGATYADNLPQGVSEGYVFYTGLNRYLSDGSDSRHLLSSIEYEDCIYNITDRRTTNTFLSVSKDQVLVISADSNIGRSLIFEYNYVDGSKTILSSIKTPAPKISFLSGGAVLIFGKETSYIYKTGSLFEIPGRVLWLGKNSVLVAPTRTGLSSNFDFSFALYSFDGETLSEKAVIPNPTRREAPIALVSDGLSNKCILKENESANQYYELDVDNYSKGFLESETKNYIATYTAELSVSPYGLENIVYEPTCSYETSSFTVSDKGITIQWQFGGEEFISLPRDDKTIPKISYLKQANLIQIKYDSRSVFTYNRETKELISSGCTFDEVPMSSQYTLWENDAYQFIVQNFTYNSLGPGYSAISFLLRKNKSTGVTDRMQKKYVSCEYYCYPYSFNCVETKDDLR